MYKIRIYQEISTVFFPPNVTKHKINVFDICKHATDVL